MKRIKPALAMLSFSLISGCSNLSHNIETNIDGSDSKASSLVKDVGHAAPAGTVGKPIQSVQHENGIWLSKNVLKVGPPALPAIFFEQATFDRTVYSLSELAERLTLRTGIPTKVSPDALAASNGSLTNASGASGASGNAGAAATGGVTAATSTNQNQSTQKSKSSIHITYSSGDLKGLLDTVASRYGVYWKYTNGIIQFYYTDSRTFQIDALPGDSSFTASVNSQSASTGGSGGSSGGGGGGSGSGGSGGVSTTNGQNTGISSQLSVYTSMEKAVHAMLSLHGKVVSSPATGTMTVVDTPDTLDRVAQFIESENKSLSRQITINVSVLSVTLDDADNYGINWNLVYGSLGGPNKLTAITNIIPAVSNLVSSVAAPQFTGTIQNPNNRLSGSQLVMQALSQQGRVRQETSATVVTLNNQPVPVQVATQTSYLASQTTTQNTNGLPPTVTDTPGSVTTGFNMSILPHVLANNTILLQFTTDFSTLVGLKVVGNIQVPTVDTRNFLQRVSMKTNETLIISGFEQSTDTLSRNGVGNASNMLFGGGSTGEKEKKIMVILITPTTAGT
jgi:type IVB pilus formation R64 PilN family outer membrane protein